LNGADADIDRKLVTVAVACAQVQTRSHRTAARRHHVGEPVPDVLLSGHHANIRRWRLKQSLGRTWLRRPELIAARALSEEENRLLEEFRREEGVQK